MLPTCRAGRLHMTGSMLELVARADGEPVGEDSREYDGEGEGEKDEFKEDTRDDRDAPFTCVARNQPCGISTPSLL